MLYIPKIDNYLKILTGEEVKYLLTINFSKYFKSIGKKNFLESFKNHFISF